MIPWVSLLPTQEDPISKLGAGESCRPTLNICKTQGREQTEA